ncbi:MAG: hypothetical protein L0J60_08495 [Psychroflexus sp.]|nr:hypothetical protein [Psychroflexus sp.]
MKFVVKSVLASFFLAIFVLFIFQLILKFILGSDSFLSLTMIIFILSTTIIIQLLFTILSTRKRYDYIKSFEHSKTLSDTSIAYMPPLKINPFKFQENLRKYFHVTIADHENHTYKFHENFDYFQVSSRFGFYLKPHAYTDQFYLEIIPYTPRMFAEKRIKKQRELIQRLLEISQ